MNRNAPDAAVPRVPSPHEEFTPRFFAGGKPVDVPTQAQLDAAWAAFQAHPIDHAEDADDEERKAVDAAVRAAFGVNRLSGSGTNNRNEGGA